MGTIDLSVIKLRPTRQTTVWAYLVDGQERVLDVPVTNVHGTMGRERDTIDAELDLANAKLASTSTNSRDGLLDGN